MKALDFKKLTKKQREACLHLIYELTFIKAEDKDNQLKNYIDCAWDPTACREMFDYLKHDMLMLIDKSNRFYEIKKALDTDDERI